MKRQDKAAELSAAPQLRDHPIAGGPGTRSGQIMLWHSGIGLSPAITLAPSVLKVALRNRALPRYRTGFTCAKSSRSQASFPPDFKGCFHPGENGQLSSCFYISCSCFQLRDLLSKPSQKLSIGISLSR